MAELIIFLKINSLSLKRVQIYFQSYSRRKIREIIGTHSFDAF